MCLVLAQNAHEAHFKFMVLCFSLQFLGACIELYIYNYIIIQSYVIKKSTQFNVVPLFSPFSSHFPHVLGQSLVIFACLLHNLLYWLHAGKAVFADIIYRVCITCYNYTLFILCVGEVLNCTYFDVLVHLNGLNCKLYMRIKTRTNLSKHC